MGAGDDLVRPGLCSADGWEEQVLVSVSVSVSVYLSVSVCMSRGRVIMKHCVPPPSLFQAFICGLELHAPGLVSRTRVP